MNEKFQLNDFEKKWFRRKKFWKMFCKILFWMCLSIFIGTFIFGFLDKTNTGAWAILLGGTSSFFIGGVYLF